MPKIFNEEEKRKIRDRMFMSGFELLKSEGMTHMSVEKITAAAGIGKSTFYNFFASKEDFVIQMIESQRQSVLSALSKIHTQSGKLSEEEGRKLLRSMVFSENSIYRYIRLNDFISLNSYADIASADSAEETELLKQVFSFMEGVREEPDYLLAANLLKIIVLTMESKQQLHTQAYENTMNVLFDALFECIFREAS